MLLLLFVDDAAEVRGVDDMVGREAEKGMGSGGRAMGCIRVEGERGGITRGGQTRDEER